MQYPLRQIALIVGELGVDTPAQQLLDRFLMGHPRDGERHQPADCQVHVWLAPGADDSELSRRLRDFPLRRHETIKSATASADAIVVVPRHIAAVDLLENVLRAASSASPVFVHGALSQKAEEARRLAAQAADRKIPLAAGTPISVTWRLPQIDLPEGARMTDALIVVQGEFPLAELHAIDGLLPVLERRRNGESGIRHVNPVNGDAVGEMVDSSVRLLLAAALSRSDSPQGDTLGDGRTQDLIRLDLVRTLAKRPRAWQIEYIDGVRSTLMVLDGVVGDFNFAVRCADGKIRSAQLFRPPPPQRHEYSRLAAVIEQYFRSRRPPWPIGRSILTSELLETFSQMVR